MTNFPHWLGNDLAICLLQKTKSLLQKATIADNINVDDLCFDNDNDNDENGYFVYHLDNLAAHLTKLQQQNVVKLWYAVKANPLSNIIGTLDQQNFNFDVASAGELAQVLAQNIDPKRILNTGPAKSKKQLYHFVKQGVNTFVVESINQLKWLNEVVFEQRVEQQQTEQLVKPTVLLRVQLQWPEGEKNPLGGNSLTPFGLATQEWQSVSLADYPALNICGLHIFQWGNMLNNDKIFSLWSQMVSPLKQLAQQLGMTLSILDLGGGLGLDYDHQQIELNWQQTVENLAQIKQQASVEELWLELGRFAVGKCGYYVTEVIDKKINYGEQQLILAAGINHIIRPAITEQPFPATTLRENETHALLSNYHVHGPLCTSLDKLGQLMLAADITIGEQVVFGYCGAYGFTESMPFFLCHSVAAEYIFSQGELTQVRAAQNPTEYLR